MERKWENTREAEDMEPRDLLEWEESVYTSFCWEYEETEKLDSHVQTESLLDSIENTKVFVVCSQSLLTGQSNAPVWRHNYYTTPLGGIITGYILPRIRSLRD